MLLAMATSIIDPELDLARVVTGVIFANPLFQFGTGDRISEILHEILTGKKLAVFVSLKENVVLMRSIWR